MEHTTQIDGVRVHPTKYRKISLHRNTEYDFMRFTQEE